MSKKKNKIKILLCVFLLLSCTACQPKQAEVEAERTQIELSNTEAMQGVNEAAEASTEEIKEIEEMKETEKTEKTGEAEEKETEESEEQEFSAKIEEALVQLTLEEKVAQLFIVTPEALVGQDNVTAAGEATKEAFWNCPVGGLIYFENNLQSAAQVSSMLSNLQAYSMERVGIPAFTCVDEEGGTVLRIGGTGKFDVPEIGSMAEIGASQDETAAYEAGSEIGSYLRELGFNVDFAPVADVLSNPENKVVKSRSFGSDPSLVEKFSLAVYKGLKEHQVNAVFKHFPGHGATEGDTHDGYAYMSKSLEELLECELRPFQAGIDAGISFVMVGHISLPNVIGDDTPASLSKVMVTQVLREKMGYDGIVITDAMNMGAIAQTDTAASSAVRALQAGVDVILMPSDFATAYQGVLDAVADGTLSEERIDEAVRRILAVKLKL